MLASDETSELHLRDYVAVLRRRARIIVLAVGVVVAAALLASFLQVPVYEAKAEILLQPRTTESLFDPTTGLRSTDPVRNVQTEVRVLESRPVREAVRQKLGTARDVAVTPFGQTDVIQVSARSTDPQQAATITNTYAIAYIDFRRKQAVDDVVAAGKELQSQVAELQRQMDALSPQATAQRNVLFEQQVLFKQKQDQLRVDSALKSGGAQLVTEATPPPDPVKPAPLRSAALALVLGLFLGVGSAFVIEYLDDSIKTKEELERAAQGLPTLGLIPSVPGWRERKRPLVVSLSDHKSPAAEAYRSLRTSIQFMGLDRPLGTIQVTSPSAGEGKTTTLANLGVALAQAGQRVVIVSCDLRRPRLHEFFGLPNDVGFTSILLGDVPLSRAVQAVEGTEGLRVVSSGPVPPNPSELLASRRAEEALEAILADSDVVLLDSTPILPVTDAAVLASWVDGTLLVATAGETTRREFHRAHEVLRQVDARVLGTVLNGVAGDAAYGYTYGYRYAYAYGEHQPNGRRGRQAATTP